MTDFERLMEEHARVNKEWMDRVSGLNDVARGAAGTSSMFALDTSDNPRRRGRLFNIDRETYLFWKANSGNAQARRRWRRRNVPNAQKVEHAADVIWRERAEPMQRVPSVAVEPASADLVDAMRYMTEALRSAP